MEELTRDRPSAANGFSLVEVMIAMVILTMGLLALAGTTGRIFAELRSAGDRTERAVAVQQVVERLGSLPFDSVRDRLQTEADTLGRYAVWWDSEQLAANLRQVMVVSQGPGYVSGHGWDQKLQDTTTITLFRP